VRAEVGAVHHPQNEPRCSISQVVGVEETDGSPPPPKSWPISRVVAVVGRREQNQVDTLDFAGGGGGGAEGSPHPRNQADTLDFAGAGDGGGQKGVTNPEIEYERARFREVVAEGSRVVYGTLAV